MPKKLSEEVQQNIADIQKIMKAGLILDCFIFSKKNASKWAQITDVKLVGKINKSSKSRYVNRQCTSSATAVGPYSTWTRLPGQLSSSYQTVTGKHAIYIHEDCFHKANNYIRHKNLLKEVPESSLVIEIKAPTEEDIDWAKSVFKNHKIETSDISIEGLRVRVTFSKTFTMEACKDIYVSSLEEAEKYQQDIIEGKRENPFSFINFTTTNYSIDPATLVKGDITVVS